MAKNPSHTNIPEIDSTSRIPQIRTAKQSKIAKPSGIVGTKISSLPKSLSNEKICQASSLVQNTTKTLFKSRFGKPPEPTPRTKMNLQPKPPHTVTQSSTQQATKNSTFAVPVTQNSTFAVPVTPSSTFAVPATPGSTFAVPATPGSTFADPVTPSRPTLTRSDTFAKDTPSAVPQNADIGNNLTQNVISKLQEQTFVASKPVRVSISPIATSGQFAMPRQMSGVKVRKLGPQVNSTPFRDSPIAKFSTKYLSEQKLLPPISFDITGTDSRDDAQGMPFLSPAYLTGSENIADVSEPSFLPGANLSSPALGVEMSCSEDIADTTAPSFLAKCTAEIQDSTSQKKFRNLAENLRDDNLIADTSNFLTTAAQSSDAKSLLNNITEDDESTIKSTTMLLCLGDESRHENTLVPILPSNGEVMDIDDRGNATSSAEANASSTTPIDMPNKQRFSFGQDITEWTLDCSIELYDSSVGSSAANAGSPSHMKKQHSFDEKSLSILTPDQMKEFLDSNNTNLNLDLPLFPKMQMHQCRVDQTPSPEELPLDPIGVDVTDMPPASDNQITSGQYLHEQQLSQTDSYSKTDQMTKSAASKVSNSFITSVTSITSLDTGYQGDGEMSRPASRGGDHSPSNMPRVHSMRPILGREPLLVNNNQNNIAIVRRQCDPMTDSDFFTESDADDMVNRGDRRAQVIDGQLYGAPMVQDANVNHYVNQQPSTEDSCMESSGIFTDVENRGDDELQHRDGLDSDMSPDGSTDTIKSSNTEYNGKKNSTVIQAHTDTFVNNHQGHSMSDSTTSTINSSCEKEQKQNKNEANVALKKHEMSKSKRLSGEKLRNASSTGVLSSVGDIENQENKRPATGGSARKVVPNKWDAVMNKIASNKTTVKSKNYNEVKSKVTCGLTKKDSPGLFKSPTAEDDVFVATSKRNYLSSSSKRGRTHSQQSSQSDISENVGSSKTKIRPNSSSSPRSAKKRDVRAIITPNDLASPKSNGALKPTSLQKRFSNGSSSAVSSSPTEQKSSPPPKKFLSKRSSTSSASAKTPLKDHNRLVGSGTPTTTTVAATTVLHATPRKIDTSPRGTISPKTTKRVILSHTSPHNTTHHSNDIVQNDRIFNNKAHTNANQVDRIVNNGKIDNCLNAIGSTRSVITATKATSTIDVVDPNLIHANKGVVAFSVLVQYLVDDLDAFNTPNLKKTNENLVNALMETKVQLEHARLNCTKLDDQLAEKDQYLRNRENEIEGHYKGELSKLEHRLNEYEQASKARITSLEDEIASKEKEYGEKLQNVTGRCQATLAEKDAELALAKSNEEELLKRIKVLSSTEHELREKVLASETDFSERLQLAAMRERELTEKFNALNKNLTEQLSSANNEILVLRSHAVLKVPASPKVGREQPIALENEIQSWRSVLEMKQKEISDLQKRNHDLEKNAAALPGALAKISGLESRLEDLTIQLKIKTDEEQELLQKNRQLEQSYKQEMKNRSVYALDNEQLKYRLKTNTEKFSSAIIELAKSQNDSTILNDLTLNVSDTICGSETTSPPSTPVVKGVVEKNTSVSYVLEINDEESPEALASRIIRRAGSFRNNDRNRLILQGNPLSQSASATSFQRQHSETGTPRTHSGLIRTRSKSVSTNSPSLLDDAQTPQANKLNVPQWNTPLCSSSPNSKRSIQTANNSNDNEESEESEIECSLTPRSNADKGQYFRRTNSYKHKRGLITCNTAALTSQRPDLSGLNLPVHPTVKELKKFQQIKESAGEAMVSGTNSEDEASTASSDGSLSSRSSSSGRRRSSLEDANIDKVVASLGAGNDHPMGPVGTPMEVSWSEDVDHFASDSAV